MHPKLNAADDIRGCYRGVDTQGDVSVCNVMLVVGELADGFSGLQELLSLAQPPGRNRCVALASSRSHRLSFAATIFRSERRDPTSSIPSRSASSIPRSAGFP